VFEDGTNSLAVKADDCFICVGVFISPLLKAMKKIQDWN